MPIRIDTRTSAVVTATIREWARAVHPGGTGSIVPALQPEDMERIFRRVIGELLELAGSEPFPVPAARAIGRQLAESPFERTRMLAPASRALLGLAPGEPGSLIATRWPFIASQAIDSYAEALQQQAWHSRNAVSPRRFRCGCRRSRHCRPGCGTRPPMTR